jgi:predicted small lipoprotein YifL
MRYWLLLAATFICFTACGTKSNDPLNPPDAPVIPPGRSSQNASPPTKPGSPAIPQR